MEFVSGGKTAILMLFTLLVSCYVFLPLALHVLPFFFFFFLANSFLHVPTTEVGRHGAPWVLPSAAGQALSPGPNC